MVFPLFSLSCIRPLFSRQLIAEELKARLEADHLTIEDYETDYSRHFKDPDDVPLPGKCHDATGKHKKTSNELAKKTKSEEVKRLLLLTISVKVAKLLLFFFLVEDEISFVRIEAVIILRPG